MDSTLIAGIMGLVGVVIGAFIGGYFSYRLQKKQKEDLCRKQVLKLLQFTHKSIKIFCETDITISENARLDCLLYDKEWYKYIAFIPELTEKEYSDTVGWCSMMLNLEAQAKRNDGRIEIILMQQMFGENAPKKNIESFANIGYIIEKLNK